jgi:hypothetical protein
MAAVPSGSTEPCGRGAPLPTTSLWSAGRPFIMHRRETHVPATSGTEPLRAVVPLLRTRRKRVPAASFRRCHSGPARGIPCAPPNAPPSQFRLSPASRPRQGASFTVATPQTDHAKRENRTTAADGRSARGRGPAGRVRRSHGPGSRRRRGRAVPAHHPGLRGHGRADARGRYHQHHPDLDAGQQPPPGDGLDLRGRGRTADHRPRCRGLLRALRRAGGAERRTPHGDPTCCCWAAASRGAPAWGCR